MFKDLIYKENKVFSTQLKRSEQIEQVMSEIRQKEDLSTAVLLLEAEGSTNALFILEKKLYAAYCLDSLQIVPLFFSDFFKKASQCDARVTLYQVSPVLFKCVLILAQYSPSVVGTPAIIDVERMLEHIKKQDQEAILVFKQESALQLFYFLHGNVRDVYFAGQKKNNTSSNLKEQVLSAGTQGDVLRVEFFDETHISAAKNHGMAEEIIAESQTLKTSKDTTPDVQKKAKKQARNKTNGLCLWVKVLGGSRAGFLIRFSPEPVSLGRGNVSVRLNDPQVSRFHAELAWGKDGLFIRDNHSTNGIFVNDKKVYRKTLVLNDIIRLGDVRLKVVAGS